MSLYRNAPQIFDYRYWNGFEGCCFLISGDTAFSDEEIEELESIIYERENGKRLTAYNRVEMAYAEGKKQGKINRAIVALLLYCQIYSTHYNLEENTLTPYGFISWAKEKETIIVPADILEWYERKKKSLPTTRQTKSKQRIAELEQQLADLANVQEQLADTKKALAEAQEEIVRLQENQPLQWFGLIAEVERMRQEGKTPVQAAEELRAAGLSNPQICALLHPTGDIKDAAQYGRDLAAGQTKNLAW